MKTIDLRAVASASKSTIDAIVESIERGEQGARWTERMAVGRKVGVKM